MRVVCIADGNWKMVKDGTAPKRPDHPLKDHLYSVEATLRPEGRQKEYYLLEEFPGALYDAVHFRPATFGETELDRLVKEVQVEEMEKISV